MLVKLPAQQAYEDQMSHLEARQQASLLLLAACWSQVFVQLAAQHCRWQAGMLGTEEQQ